MRLLTAQEAQQVLGVSVVTLWRWRRRYGLPFLQVGRSIRFDAGALGEWAIAHRAEMQARPPSLAERILARIDGADLAAAGSM